MSDSELLDQVNTAIAARLAGQAVDEWGEGAHRIAHVPLAELYKMRSDLQGRIAGSGEIFLPVIDAEEP